MPTINEVIQRVDRTRPNALEGQDKARWLLELDGQVYEELTKADAPEVLPPRSWPGDGDAQLLVQPPYDNIYDLYLTAMVEFFQGDYSDYNNTAVLFGQARAEHRAAYRRAHPPKGAAVTGLF